MREKTQVLFVSPDRYALGISPDRTVSLFLDFDPMDAPWVHPEFRMAVELSPTQARQLAQALTSKAAEAEARQPPTIQ